MSYPSKVAPLPEFKGAESVGKDVENLQTEARKLSYLRNLDRQEEVEKVPFPRIIRTTERKQPKSLLDLHTAIKEVKAKSKRNFLETIEAHVRLGVNPRRSDQTVRGAVTLPHGTGKDVRVAVFADGNQGDEAKAAGADIVGGDELIEEIKKGGGKLNFDKCIATPSFMPRLAKIARILGPRGLMPNPKLGSVTSNVSEAVKEAKCGRVDFKMDKTAIVHVGIGKANFSEEALRENIGAFVNSLLSVKPAGLKKTSRYAGYVNEFSLSSTMGSGYPVSIQSLSESADNYNKLHPKTTA